MTPTVDEGIVDLMPNVLFLTIFLQFLCASTRIFGRSDVMGGGANHGVMTLGSRPPFVFSPTHLTIEFFSNFKIKTTKKFSPHEESFTLTFSLIKILKDEKNQRSSFYHRTLAPHVRILFSTLTFEVMPFCVCVCVCGVVIMTLLLQATLLHPSRRSG